MQFNTCCIPSNGGEQKEGKTIRFTPLLFSFHVWVCFQQDILTIMVMSLVSHRPSPVSKEYFHPSFTRVYKVCNRYRINDKTLEDFGIIIDQGKLTLPKVGSHDSMSITTPLKNKADEENKPFCCKYCGSEHYIKYGKENNKQMYKCKDCNRKFVDNLYFERMKADPKIICLTLDLYFKGVSLRKISDHLKQFYSLDVYFTTIFRWIGRYVRIMDEYVRQFKPRLGDMWNVDEMSLKIHGDWFYLWNVIDDETRFHLASYVSKQRSIEEARMVLRTAKKRSHGKRPRCIVTDGLNSYRQAVDKEFHTARRDTLHIGNVGICGKKLEDDYFDNNVVERLQGTIRERNKTQRGLKDEYSMFVRGHQLYYNFIRPHQSLYGLTPSEVANVNLNLMDRKWENLLMQSMKYHNDKD